MALLIEAPELEQRLSEHAAREGTTPDVYARRLLERGLESLPPVTAPTVSNGVQEKGVLSGYGKFAAVGPAPEQRRAWKEEEMAREAAKMERRSEGHNAGF